MKYILATFCVIVIGIHSLIAQDLDDVFSDQQRTLTVNVGTSIGSWFGGIANAELDCRLFDNHIISRLGVGVIPFGYVNVINYSESYKVYKTGTMEHFAANFRIAWYGMDRSSEIFIGPRIEYLMFTGSQASETSHMKDKKYFENSGASELAFSRKNINLGVSIHLLKTFSNRLSTLIGLTCGLSRMDLKYNASNSVNVNWESNAPQSWFHYENSMYERIHIGIYYRLF